MKSTQRLVDEISEVLDGNMQLEDLPCKPVTTQVCTCEDVQHEYHSCPYREEVDGEPNSLCNCCPSCTDDCADSV